MSSQSIQTFEFEKGRTFVSGLMWQTLSSPKNMMAESRELASELDFDLMVYREGLMPQVGLASTTDGAKEGLMSSAALVSKFHETDGSGVLCAMPIPDGRFLLVAIRDGAILPDGDIVGNEDEIEEQFNQLLSLSASEWGIRVAPSTWGVESSIERDFQFYIPKKKNGSIEYHSWWELRSPVSDRKRATKKLLIIAAIAVTIAGGVAGVKKFQEYREQQRALAQQEAAQNQRANPSDFHVDIPTPWKDTPHPALVLAACESHYAPKYLFAGGWILRDFSCASRSVTYIWSRGSTSFPSLRATIPTAIANELEDSASVTIPFGFVSAPPPADIGNIGDVKSAFIRKMQSIDIKFNLVAVPFALTPPPGAPADFILPQPDYKSYQWEIPGTPLSPRTMTGLIDGKSMRVSSVIARIGGPGVVEWSYKGEMYGKN